MSGEDHKRFLIANITRQDEETTKFILDHVGTSNCLEAFLWQTIIRIEETNYLVLNIEGRRWRLRTMDIREVFEAIRTGGVEALVMQGRPA